MSFMLRTRSKKITDLLLTMLSFRLPNKSFKELTSNLPLKAINISSINL